MTFEIGKFYKVPCVWAEEFYHARNIWIPVIGPLHEDKEHIKFEPRHWHIDWRFAQARFIYPAWRSPYATVLCKDLASWRTPNVLNTKGPELKRRKMLRDWPTYPAELVERNWLPKLRKAFAGCTLKPGAVCPHRGIPLEHAAREGDVVTCPGHGLRWNVKTGELVA